MIVVSVTNIDQASNFFESLIPLGLRLGGAGRFESATLFYSGGQTAGGFLSSVEEVNISLFAQKDVAVVVVTRDGRIFVSSAELSRLEVPSPSALLVDCRGAQSFSVSVAGDIALITLDIQDLLMRLAELTDGPLRRDIEFSGNMALATASSSALFLMIRAMCQFPMGVTSSPIFENAIGSLKRAVIDTLFGVFASNYSDDLQRACSLMITPKYVRRAIEFMRLNVAQPIKISEVARSVSITKRSLELGFKRFTGVAPAAYLRELRLNGVRADLLDSSKVESVSEIARAWGFLHLGLFARHYRQAFGELPSATLARRSEARLLPGKSV